ncbi:MAG: quinate/shikimate dehydrogenase, partial [Oscillospiraceae bacterium]|nr:quinate/shikimate dehydrogenase [Oscillospiraceae bacterium]
MISGATRLLAVIGSPVSHSKSPLIHNAFAANGNSEYAYLAFDVTRGTLPDFLAAARALPIAGFNVTMPLKEAIVPYLDELDDFTRIIGAANTVVNRGGRLAGYNTDGDGVTAALNAHGVRLADAYVLVLGAGGAAKAACLALANAGARVTAL